MSQPRTPPPAKLVVGAIVADKGQLGPAAGQLTARYGPLDMVSPWYRFDQTDYYEKEMGRPLYRRLLVLRRLVDQAELVEAKWLCFGIEQQTAEAGRRRVNLDPGLLTFERFVLATGKNYTHRIYLGRQVFADLTLVWENGSYRPLAWTYPDYRGQQLRSFLSLVREKYRLDLRRCRAQKAGQERH